MTQTNAIETKAAGEEATLAFAEFARTFEAFRETNDERLGQIERRLSADVITEEKLSRIDQALDETKARMDRIALKARRPALGERDDAAEPAAQREHKAAFEAYMRTGDAQGLKQIEAKALSAGSGPDGGFLVPVPQERELLRRMSLVSPIRALATVREISGSQLKKAFSTTGPASGWVNETAARPQTNSQVLADLTFPAMELYAMPSATQTLLDDGAVDVEAGSPTRSRPSSPSGRGRPSSAATASTSQGACSPTIRSPRPPGAGAMSAISRPASRAASRRSRRPTS